MTCMLNGTAVSLVPIVLLKEQCVTAAVMAMKAIHGESEQKDLQDKSSGPVQRESVLH